MDLSDAFFLCLLYTKYGKWSLSQLYVKHKIVFFRRGPEIGGDGI